MTHTHRLAQAAAFIYLAMLAGREAVGQTITPDGPAQAARFEAARQAVARAGYTNPAVVGAGTGATAPLLALLGTRENAGALVVVRIGTGASGPAALETAATPADLSIRGITFGPFLDSAGLFDVVVHHAPFMLETSRTFDTHHLVRQQGGTLQPVCEFAGDASSTASKGIGSIRSTRHVTIDPRPSTPANSVSFDVTTVDETITQTGNAPPATTARTEAHLTFVLPAGGTCTSR